MTKDASSERPVSDAWKSDPHWYDMYCEARDKLATIKQAVGECLAGLVHSDVSPEARRRIGAAIDRALLAAAPAPAIQVKALEWREYKALGNRTKLCAFDCFGNEFARIDLPRSDEYIEATKAIEQAHYEQRILSALSHPEAASPAAAGEVNDAARDAVWKVVHEAWQLLDDTEFRSTDPQPYVDLEGWERLSAAMDALQQLVPESEQPFWGGYPVKYLWPTTPSSAPSPNACFVENSAIRAAKEGK